MIKDLFFTLASFVLVFCGLLYWNHFWREYLTAKVHYKTGNVVLAIEHYSKALSESSRGIIKEAEQSLRQEILAMTGEFDWKNSNAFLKALAIMTKDKSSDHSQTISEANQLLYDLIIEYSINKDGVGLELLSKVLFQANPNLSLAFLAQGEGDLLSGNLSQAVKAYESCLEREPFFERGVIKLVEIYQKDEQYRDIIRVAEPNILKVKPSFKFLSALGKAYFFDKQLSKAVTPLEDSLAIKPKNFPNLVLLGRIGLALDEPKLVDNLEIAWSHDKTRLDELEKWLKFQLEIENFQRVIAFLDLNPLFDEKFQIIEMEALVKSKAFEKFERFLTRTTLNSESNPEIKYFHGVMALENGNHELAEKKLKEFLRTSGITGNQKRKTLEYLIEIAKKTNKLYLERSYLRQLMYLVPSLSKVHLDVGETYEREGNPNKALKTYLGALEHFPTSWALLEKACSMLLVKEAYFKVIALLQDTKMMPEKPELPLLLIRAYLGIYDYQAAKRVVDRMTVMPDRKIVIPDDLIFLVQESVDRLVPPVGYEQNLEVLHQQEKSFLESLQRPDQQIGPNTPNNLKQRSSLSRFIQKTDFSGMSLQEFTKMCDLLLENGANSKVIELLYGKEETLAEASLAFILARAMTQEFDYFGARSVLTKTIDANRNSGGIPEDLKFLMESDLPSPGMTDEEIKQRIAKLRSEEEKFLASLTEYSAKFAKNVLPPDPDQTRKLALYGMLRKDHTHRGNGEVFLPQGTDISLLDVLTEEQKEILTLKEGRSPFFLCQYAGKLHQIDAKYIQVIDPPEGEKLGVGKIHNLDFDYSARAELEKSFRFGERVEIVRSTVHDRDQVMLFDNESYASFFSIPKEGFTVKDQAKVFHNFSKEVLKLEAEYEFLKNEVFAEIYEIPSESRMVLFGPEGGGVSVFTIDSNKTPLPIHQIKIHEMVKDIPRYERNFSRIDYLGSMVIDVNNDDVLDYLTLWRSHIQSNRALIHAAVSNSEGKFRDFLIPTEMGFVAEYQFKSRISLLNFLQDSDLDGHLEILVYRPFSVISGESYKIPWYELFKIEKDNLVRSSRKFPEFYADQRQMLKKLRKKKEEEIQSKLQYQSWLAGYLKVMERIGEYTGS